MLTKAPLEEPHAPILQPTRVFLVRLEVYSPKPQKHKLEAINLAVLALMLVVVVVKPAWEGD